MFNSLVGTQTPTYQVWNFGSIALSATRRIALEDDCAPLQIIACGGTGTQIFIYLPINPPPGKTITFRANNYGAGTTFPLITIYESTVNNSTILVTLNEAQGITLCYAPELAPGRTSPAGAPLGSKWAVIHGPSLPGSNLYSDGSIILAGSEHKLNGAIQSFIGVGINNIITGATSNNAIVSGAFNTVGNGAVILGGNIHTATGISSGIVAGSQNSVNGGYSGVAFGSTNTIGSQQYSSIVGGRDNTIQSSGDYSVIAGGQENIVSGYLSSILGGRRGTTRGITGLLAIPACDVPIAEVNGVSQGAILVLARETTDATATVLTSNTSPASTNNQIILPDNAAYHFKASIISTVTGGGDTAAWTIEGVVKRGSGAGTAVLVGTPSVNLVARDTGAATWTIAVTADTTNGGISFTFTGQASTTIRTVCKVETTEVTY